MREYVRVRSTVTFSLTWWPPVTEGRGKFGGWNRHFDSSHHSPSIFQCRTPSLSPDVPPEFTWAPTSRLCSGRDATSRSFLTSDRPGVGAYLWPRWSEGPKWALFHGSKMVLVHDPPFSLSPSLAANVQSVQFCCPLSSSPSLARPI